MEYLSQIFTYLAKEAGWLHLERDDRREVDDKLIIDGKDEVHPINQEIITIRTRHGGEYVVNLYYYKAYSNELVSVDVKVDRINPKYETVYRETIVLNRQDEEITAVRFSIDDDGAIYNVNKLPMKLTPYGLEHMPAEYPDWE